MGSREFVSWTVFLNREAKEPRREDYYLAQIAAEVRRSRVKNPRSVRVEQLLLRFTTSPGPPPDAETRTRRSKAFWLSGLGLSEELREG